MSDPSSQPAPGAEPPSSSPSTPPPSSSRHTSWDPDLDSPTRTVICPLCNELFNDAKGLQAHLADVHRYGNKKKVRTKVVATNKPGQSHYVRKRETLSLFTDNFAGVLAAVVILVVVIALVYPPSLFVSVPVGVGLLVLARTGVFRK
jgi:hypothetical protein